MAATQVTETTAPAATAPAFEPVVVGLSPEGYLVDSDGFTLYLFTLDERTSACAGACADAWPPLLGDPQAADGVFLDLLDNAERDNGAIQVTYGGHPLYTYSGDAAPGDTNGQGFNDFWYMVDANGEPVRR